MSNEINLATVGEVYADGLSLIFDGQDAPTEKHYKCNTSVEFHAGDRVKILKDSGTYIVEYVVGNPTKKTAPSSLENDAQRVYLSSNGYFYPPKGGVALGASNYPWRGLYAEGTISLGTAYGNTVKLGGNTASVGFFGHTAARQQSVSNNASVSTLISALKAYGLIR